MLNPPGPEDLQPEPRAPYPDARGAEGVEEIAARLESRLDEPARTWLHSALAEAARAPGETSWEAHFAAAGRHCGRACAADARVLLLRTAGAGAETLTRLYRQGTAGERVAVLRALPHLPAGVAPELLPLVEDALRANDTSLVAAAVGPYGAAHLDAHGWRHAVLKCLFTGVALDAVAGLERRARGDAELARMLDDFARERTAAGRDVPADLHRALRLTGPRGGSSGPDPSDAVAAPPHPPQES
ncbi:EboA domain-containing protein [Streptomyces winkii]|uniref:EboA domain-containing protein n=1 Tax=Streptomyces winkii TaxID=3051178 RepID=UPI0028D8ED65|nr:EboA domain-containing protein [Streptomyces sp. DSM 40971]